MEEEKKKIGIEYRCKNCGETVEKIIFTDLDFSNEIDDDCAEEIADEILDRFSKSKYRIHNCGPRLFGSSNVARYGIAELTGVVFYPIYHV